MPMPSGNSPHQVDRYYNYLQGHQQTMQSSATWHVRWVDLAWLWGFAVVLALILIWWVWQYRTTRQKTGIYPVDSFGGYATELAGPSSLFFLLLTAIVTGFAVVLIVGHIVWGQLF
jgi:hypothetical protein